MANYWASGSVKLAAVVTVSARWTIELVFNKTVGGVFSFHTSDHLELLLLFVNQQFSPKNQSLWSLYPTVWKTSINPPQNRIKV